MHLSNACDARSLTAAVMLEKEIHLKKINLTEKFSLFTNHWEPRIVYQVIADKKTVKLIRMWTHYG